MMLNNVTNIKNFFFLKRFIFGQDINRSFITLLFIILLKRIVLYNIKKFQFKLVIVKA